MLKYVCEGKKVLHTAGANIASGDIVVLECGIGFADNDIANGAEGPVSVEGAFEVVKKSGEAWAAGDRLFYSAADEDFSKVEGDDRIPAGFARKAQGSSDTEGEIILAPTILAQAANVTAISTADGSDAGTTQTLANATKAKVNSILVALKAAGIMVDDA